VREIRMLRSMWRGLETESRLDLHGHERGNPGHRQDHDLRTTAPALDPTREGRKSEQVSTRTDIENEQGASIETRILTVSTA
jgi:hypothetical protein